MVLNPTCETVGTLYWYIHARCLSGIAVETDSMCASELWLYGFFAAC